MQSFSRVVTCEGGDVRRRVAPATHPEIMNVETSRKSHLPPIRLDVASLDDLVQRVRAHFADPADVRVYIELNLGNTIVEASEATELLAFADMPSTVADFNVRWSGKSNDQSQRVKLESRQFMHWMPGVSAGSNSTGWCAGAVEVVRDFFERRPAPYGWFSRLPMSRISWACGGVLLSGQFLIVSKPSVYLRYGAIALTVFLTACALDRIQRRYFPPALIVVREERHKGVQVATIATLLGVLVSLLAWWFPRAP